MKKKSIAGQVAVEYILLLAIAALAGTILMKTLVSRSPEEPGYLTKKWFDMLSFIGQDTTTNKSIFLFSLVCDISQ